MTGGLGSATGRALKAKGAKLALLYAPFEAERKDEVLKTSYDGAGPDEVSAHECDITSEESVAAAFSEIASDAARRNVFPSILINAAGYVTVQPLEETSAEEAIKNIIPNIIGPFNVSKAFQKVYLQRKAEVSGESKAPPGRIVSISSQAAHVALDGHGAYCASKAGLNGLNRCMANEWGPHGITCNTVSPTVVMTVLGKKAWADDKKRENMLAQIPTGRFAEPEEIGEAIEFLCRDESAMINGADIRVDGGFTIR